jgi:adenine/guanine phosphoribosyltransferase-like PRPP-binding protein
MKNNFENKHQEHSPMMYNEGSYKSETNVELAIRLITDKVTNILMQLGEGIRKGEYPVILGVDASGRVPAILMAKTIRRIYAALGHERPIVKFVSGAADEEILLEYASEKIKPLVHDKQKVLVVDDTVYSGDTLRAIKHTLERADIPTELVALELLNTSVHINKKVGQQVIIGGVLGDKKFPPVYGKPSMSGVSKVDEELHSRTYRRENVPAGDPTDLQIRRRVKDLTDQYAEDLAAGFLDKYNKEVTE